MIDELISFIRQARFYDKSFTEIELPERICRQLAIEIAEKSSVYTFIPNWPSSVLFRLYCCDICIKSI